MRNDLQRNYLIYPFADRFRHFARRRIEAQIMENSLLSRPYTSPIVSFALGSDNSPRCNPESHHSLTLSQPLKPKDNSNESGNSLPKLNTKDLDHKYSIRFKKIPSYAGQFTP